MSRVQNEFEQQLNDPSVSFVRDYSAESRLMLVAFGGINQGLGMTPFEFFQLARSVPVKKLFFRDLHQAWYHRGLGAAGGSIRQAADFIAKEISAQRVTRVVMFGNSMGGYAALLFGCLAGVQEVHAFSPQTFISPWKLIRHRDSRWKYDIWRAYLSREPATYYDLRAALPAGPSTRCVIHYSTASKLDTVHARHLEGFPNVVLQSYPEGGHRVIKHLKQTGALAGLLEQALVPDEQSRAGANQSPV
jgi:pimeloyl-ACP methyl ester carboxylesterase